MKKIVKNKKKQFIPILIGAYIDAYCALTNFALFQLVQIQDCCQQVGCGLSHFDNEKEKSISGCEASSITEKGV